MAPNGFKWLQMALNSSKQVQISFQAMAWTPLFLFFLSQYLFYLTETCSVKYTVLRETFPWEMGFSVILDNQNNHFVEPWWWEWHLKWFSHELRTPFQKQEKGFPNAIYQACYFIGACVNNAIQIMPCNCLSCLPSRLVKTLPLIIPTVLLSIRILYYSL